MAEKPRLKKSEDILGSIASQPRPPRIRGSRREKDRDDGEQGAKTAKGQLSEYDDDEGFELSEPALPSAQSLAEKLLARENSRKLNFEKYELPKRDAVQHAEIEFDPAPAPQSFSFESDLPAAPSKASGAQNKIEQRPMTAGPQSFSFESAEQAAPPKTRETQKKAEPDPASSPAQLFSFEPAAQAAPLKTPAPPEETKPVKQPAARPVANNAARQVQSAAADIALEQNIEPAPVVTEYTFQSFEDEVEAPAGELEMRREDEPSTENGRSLRERAKRRSQNIPAQQKEAIPPPGVSNDMVDSQARQQPKRESQYRDMPKTAARDFEPEIPPVEEPEIARTGKVQSQPDLSPEEQRRKDFLERISSQFDQQFDEKFGERAPKPYNARKPDQSGGRTDNTDSIFDRPRRAAESAPVHTPDPNEDFFTALQRQNRQAAPADARRNTAEPDPGDFIERFKNDVVKEEERRTEEFKETLADKFMRERERYLKELGINMQESPVPPDPEAPAFTPPQRRRLDFQIQPEMHTHDGSKAAEAPKPVPKTAPSPVIYSRGAVARQQTHDAEPVRQIRPAVPAGKKTSEQLLMEHGRLARSISTPQQQKPAKFNFRFDDPEKPSQDTAKNKKESILFKLPKEKWSRRIVIISLISGLLAICLLLLPLVRYLMPPSAPDNQDPRFSESAPAFESDNLDVYDNRSFDQTAKVNNVVFKNAGLTLKNVDVKDYVIIEGISSKGKLRLEDVTVGTAVSLKTSGVDTLELHNVKADRVIVDNADAEVTISATGTTEIGIIEVRTPATLRQSDIADGSPGVRDVSIMPGDNAVSITARLNGLNLRSLSTDPADTVLNFEETQAESMSSDGSLSLSGTGKVTNLSIGAKSGQGAGEFADKKDINLFIKGVSVTTINIKSTANVNLATTVDSVSTTDNINIGGEGTVGSLTLNPGAARTRMKVDVAGLNIQSVYANAPSSINVTGSANINEMIANASTYALGNKVNHLIANADDVIYEEEPDKKTVPDGIRPPQSKVDNPNLDYDTDLPQTETSTDAADSDFGTTCGHSRETGGFVLGDGSRDNPFEVSTPLQLEHVGAHLDSYFIQTENIDLATESKFASSFPMIGQTGDPFAGNYDGRGYAIANLRIISSDESVGLFAANSGTIRNVWLVSGNVSSNATKRSFIGGLVGLNLDEGTIRSCSNGAAVTGNQNTYTGGIAGYNFGAKIHDCFNYAKISGVDTVGGIVGLNRQSATLTGSYNAGTVEGENEFGAVVGKNEDATVANCYYLTDTADYGIGDGGGTAIEKTSEELQDPQMAADLAAGNENSLWIPGQTTTGGYHYPMHKKPPEEE